MCTKLTKVKNLLNNLLIDTKQIRDNLKVNLESKMIEFTKTQKINLNQKENKEIAKLYINDVIVPWVNYIESTESNIFYSTYQIHRCVEKNSIYMIHFSDYYPLVYFYPSHKFSKSDKTNVYGLIYNFENLKFMLKVYFPYTDELCYYQILLPKSVVNLYSSYKCFNQDCINLCKDLYFQLEKRQIYITGVDITVVGYNTKSIKYIGKSNFLQML